MESFIPFSHSSVTLTSPSRRKRQRDIARSTDDRHAEKRRLDIPVGEISTAADAVAVDSIPVSAISPEKRHWRDRDVLDVVLVDVITYPHALSFRPCPSSDDEAQEVGWRYYLKRDYVAFILLMGHFRSMNRILRSWMEYLSMEIGTSSWSYSTHLMGKNPSMGCTISMDV